MPSNNVNNVNSRTTLNSFVKMYNKNMINNNVVSYCLIGLIILITILVPQIPDNVLFVVNNGVFRIVSLVVICLLCLVDPIKALLLAILLVVAIQQVNVRNRNYVSDVQLNIVSEEEIAANNNNVVSEEEIAANNNNVSEEEIAANNNNVVYEEEIAANNNNVVYEEEIAANNNNVVAANNNNVAANNNNVAANNNNVAANNNIVPSNSVNNVIESNQVNNNSNIEDRINNMNLDNVNNLVINNGNNVVPDNNVNNMVLNNNIEENANVSGFNHHLLNTNPLDNSLLLGDLPNYKLESDNTYTGEYGNNVNSYNQNNLITVNPYINNCSCINSCSCKNRGSCNVGNVIREGFTDADSNSNNSDVSINSILNNVDNSESDNLVNSINNIINRENGVEINNEIPKNLLFTSTEQLNSAQSRSINNQNKDPVRSGENMLSAQGYGSNSGIVGFNESGAPAINYLCVDN